MRDYFRDVSKSFEYFRREEDFRRERDRPVEDAYPYEGDAEFSRRRTEEYRRENSAPPRRCDAAKKPPAVAPNAAEYVKIVARMEDDSKRKKKGGEATKRKNRESPNEATKSEDAKVVGPKSGAEVGGRSSAIDKYVKIASDLDRLRARVGYYRIKYSFIRLMLFFSYLQKHSDTIN